MRAKVLSFLATGLAILTSTASAQGTTSDSPEFDFGQDHFAAGRRVIVVQPVTGDLLAAGRQVSVSASISGDAVATGADVQLAGPVQQNAFVAGGQVSLASTIGRNARIAGAKVTLQPQARINGNATLAGGEVDISGEVGGYLIAGGKLIRIDGPIGGDVRVAAKRIELGPNARIKGNLRYRSGSELKRDASAQIGGTVERLPWQGRTHGRSRAPLTGLLIWSLGLGVAAAILLATMPLFTQRVSSAARTRFGWSLLLGFIAFVCIPVALIVVLSTIIGIPVALLVLLAYPILLLLGYVLAGVALGDAGLRRIRPESLANRNTRIIAAVIALLILGLLARIPFLGGLIGFVTLLVGLGALLQGLRDTSRAGASPTHAV